MRPSPAPRPRRLDAVLAAVVGLAALGLSAPSARAEEAPPAAQQGDTITWVEGVAKAFEMAREKNRMVMICINSTRVDGGRKEPAAEGLREVVYKDPRIVGRSRDFVCVFLGATSSGDDFGELKVLFGMDGYIVSPQHIFARPDHQGGDPLVRLEYWPYGKDQKAVDELIALMDKAAERWRAEGGTPPPTSGTPDGGAPGAPEGGAAPGADAAGGAAPAGEAERKAWIDGLLAIVRAGPTPRRVEAIRTLMVHDQEGDTIDPLIAMLAEPESGKNTSLVVDLVRGLGRPGLVKAAPGIAEHLGHKEQLVRANAAVSLEYIGCPDSVDALAKQVKREKDAVTASHMWRALGRCGVADSKVRSSLLKAAGDTKDEIETFGPIIGLAYFKGDAKAARGVEKLAAKLGPPSFGRRGGGQGFSKRSIYMWVLASIADPKSAEFVQDRMLDPLEHVQNQWIGRTKRFYRNVKKACEGEEGALSEVEGGVQFILGMGEGNPLQDIAREGREDAGFKPLFDWKVAGGQGAGGMGGGDEE
ncbi:MAG: HEAT repeat domain-containing protein [Planctomycetota bacterium]